MNCGYSDGWLCQRDTSKFSGAESLFRDCLHQKGLWASLWVIVFIVFIDVQRLSPNVWVASDDRQLKGPGKITAFTLPGKFISSDAVAADSFADIRTSFL